MQLHTPIILLADFHLMTFSAQCITVQNVKIHQCIVFICISVRDEQLLSYDDNRDYFAGNNQHRPIFIT